MFTPKKAVFGHFLSILIPLKTAKQSVCLNPSQNT